MRPGQEQCLNHEVLENSSSLNLNSYILSKRVSVSFLEVWGKENRDE